MANKTVTSVALKRQSGTTNTYYVSWSWSSDHTKEYRVIWYYLTADGITFKGNDNTVKTKYDTYDPPSQAYKIGVKIKPTSETHKVSGKDTDYWTADWSTTKYLILEEAGDLGVPDQPELELLPNGNVNIRTTWNNISPYTNPLKNILFRFEMVADGVLDKITGGTPVLVWGREYSTSINRALIPGKHYKIRCQVCSYKTVNKKRVYTQFGAWSEYADIDSFPAAPGKFITNSATSKDTIELTWVAGAGAKTYEIEYTDDINNFDKFPAKVQTEQTDDSTCKKIISGFTENGGKWYFRCRSVNDAGKSAWNTITSTSVGTKPSPPTTWSLSNSYSFDDDIVFYWTHNAVDNSKQTEAYLYMTINGVNIPTINPTIPVYDDDHPNPIGEYHLDKTLIPNGGTIVWKMKTRGVTGIPASDASISRTITVNQTPFVTMTSSSFVDGVLTSFPINLSVSSGPSPQTVVRHFLSIVADETYETTDIFGNLKYVSRGEALYTTYFDEDSEIAISPGEVTLENNVRYRIHITSAMNSGLNAENDLYFETGWVESDVEINAEVAYDGNNYAYNIRPYALIDGEETTDCYFYIYRKELTGELISITDILDAVDRVSVMDPHPALDYARYRIVYVNKLTSTMDYYDLPAYPIQEKSIIIQWDETWRESDNDSEDIYETPEWSGSRLILPYNIDVSYNYQPQVSTVDYIGRKHPVSYYGTHIGESATWTTTILKNDTDTITALHRLSNYKGDVYVREPNGTGYWAQITLSFSLNHCELVVPVTFNVLRVEGGV